MRVLGEYKGKVEEVEVDHDKLEKETAWMPIFLMAISCTIAFVGAFLLR